jgi:hypothetical protein
VVDLSQLGEIKMKTFFAFLFVILSSLIFGIVGLVLSMLICGLVAVLTWKSTAHIEAETAARVATITGEKPCGCAVDQMCRECTSFSEWMTVKESHRAIHQSRVLGGRARIEHAARLKREAWQNAVLDEARKNQKAFNQAAGLAKVGA